MEQAFDRKCIFLTGTTGFVGKVRPCFSILTIVSEY